MRFLIILFCLIPSFALTQELFRLNGDLNNDNLPDLAVISGPDEYGNADLLIYLGQPNGDMTLHTTAKSLIWTGGIGQQPELDITSHGSLLVHSMNQSIGRNRWHLTLTVAWRKNDFILAGYTYRWHDTVGLFNAGTCDVNLLAGKGELVQGEEHDITIAFHTKSRSGPIDLWDKMPPKECFED